MTHKVGQSDLVLEYDEGALVGLCMQDYKCLCAVVMICATIVPREFDFYILIPVTTGNRSNRD